MTITPKQLKYLQSLRAQAGLPAYRAAKRRLGIETPGTHRLTKTEAAALIGELKAELDSRPTPAAFGLEIYR